MRLGGRGDRLVFPLVPGIPLISAGLAPLGAGGGDFAHWHRFAEGLANGTDPAHPEYWGTVNGRDQRMVELAALGFALALVPEKIWEPLDAPARGNVEHESSVCPIRLLAYVVMIVGIIAERSVWPIPVAGMSVSPRLEHQVDLLSGEDAPEADDGEDEDEDDRATTATIKVKTKTTTKTRSRIATTTNPTTVMTVRTMKMTAATMTRVTRMMASNQ